MAALFKGSRKNRRNSPDDPEEFRLTLVEHLEELRKRVYRSVLFLAAGWVAGWYLEPPIYAKLDGDIRHAIEPVLKEVGVTYRAAFKSATDAFFLQFKLAFIIGATLAFPFILLQLWGFIEPALHPKERKPFKVAAPFSLVLFFAGAGLCWLVIPAAISWFATYLGNFKNTELIQEPGLLIFFVLKLLLAFGIAFQLPLIVYALNAIGLLETEALTKNWRQITAGVFCLAMIVTPSNDWITMLAMAIPVSLLFVATVVVVRAASRRRKRDDAIAEYGEDD